MLRDVLEGAIQSWRVNQPVMRGALSAAPGRKTETTIHSGVYNNSWSSMAEDCAKLDIEQQRVRFLEQHLLPYYHHRIGRSIGA